MLHKQLPDGWQWTTFGKVAHQVSESTRDPIEDGFERYVGLEHLDPDSLFTKRWGLTQEDNPTFTKVFREGQLLFGRRRAYQRKAAVADFDGICSGDIIVMEAKPEQLLPDLLPFIVQSEGFWDYAIHTSAGSLSPRTKWSHLARYEFPLPPMDEQRRIAEILWAVEEAIEHYVQVEQSVDVLLWSKFHQMIDHVEYPSEPLGNCILSNGGNSTYPHEEPTYVGLEHMESGEWVVSQFDDSEKYTSNCHKFKAGDLLYGKLRPYLDKCAIATFPGVCSTEILVLQPTEKVTVEYLMYHFHSRPFISHNDVRSYGTKMPRTSLGIVAEYTIPVPQIDIQMQIIETLDAIRLRKVEIRAQIARLKELKERIISVRLGQ